MIDRGVHFCMFSIREKFQYSGWQTSISNFAINFIVQHEKNELFLSKILRYSQTLYNWFYMYCTFRMIGNNVRKTNIYTINTRNVGDFHGDSDKLW